MSSPSNSKLGTVCSVFECSMRSHTNFLSTVKMHSFPASPSRRLLCNETIGKQIRNLCFAISISLQGNFLTIHSILIMFRRIFSCMEDEGSSSSVN
ncbi:uncharacterized protein TNCV_2582781 [Trichonephila clavipes]|nr:uncharacterized protein TNCV_2582781 [Trichonephila clavipes]